MSSVLEISIKTFVDIFLLFVIHIITKFYFRTFLCMYALSLPVLFIGLMRLRRNLFIFRLELSLHSLILIKWLISSLLVKSLSHSISQWLFVLSQSLQFALNFLVFIDYMMSHFTDKGWGIAGTTTWMIGQTAFLGLVKRWLRRYSIIVSHAREHWSGWS